MSAQDVIFGAEFRRLRDLKADFQKLKDENAALKRQNEALTAHFSLAVLAAAELAESPLEIWDGWNLILGSPHVAKDREELFALAETRANEPDAPRLWLVFDGHDERVVKTGRVRVSYTGGTGEHRADRFILAFVRMAAYRGLAARVSVRTNDRDFRAQVCRLGGVAI